VLVGGAFLGKTGVCNGHPLPRKDTAVNYSTLPIWLLATPWLRALLPCQPLLEPLLPCLEQLGQLLEQFRSRPVTPQTTYDLEQQLQRHTRELARKLLEWQLNQLEPDDSPQAPPRLCHDGDRYRRRGKHPNTLATLFGEITLRRFLYEPYEPGEKCIHPLEQRLGVVAGCATPARAERAGQAAAERPQRQALEQLRRDHDVAWSADTYRKVTGELSAALAEQRQPAQVTKVLAWLRQAQASRGRHRPLLCAGRDGIHVPLVRGPYREGATATLAVFDRRGKRLGTVYLGRMPEPGQRTLSQQLTDLIVAVLAAWEGPPPRLAYVTDGGWHPTDYYAKVLRKLEDPRRPGQRLHWERVIDFYHAAGYVYQLGEALFGDTAAGRAWARRMRQRLRDEPCGVTRVLQSAAYHRNQRQLSAKREQAYAEAYNYLRKRRRFLDYHGCRRRGVPLGSGVTEAACKTVFTQRLKQSGMRWQVGGGQVVLDLRVLRLSGVWDDAFRAYLRRREEDLNDTHTQHTAERQEKAA
jgi:hypothetical protein